MDIKKIAIGADHAGYEYKEKIKAFLTTHGIEVTDFGTSSTESVDYPDFVHPVAEAVEGKQVELGIVVCGSGNGVAMAANKHQSIRAALCWNEKLAALARQHNNANVLALPSRFVGDEMAIKMVDVFLRSEFEGGRHERRVDKIACG